MKLEEGCQPIVQVGRILGSERAVSRVVDGLIGPLVPVRLDPAAPTLTAWPAQDPAGFGMPVAGWSELGSKSGAGRCVSSWNSTAQ